MQKEDIVLKLEEKHQTLLHWLQEQSTNKWQTGLEGE